MKKAVRKNLFFWTAFIFSFYAKSCPKCGMNLEETVAEPEQATPVSTKEANAPAEEEKGTSKKHGVAGAVAGAVVGVAAAKAKAMLIRRIISLVLLVVVFILSAISITLILGPKFLPGIVDLFRSCAGGVLLPGLLF